MVILGGWVFLMSEVPLYITLVAYRLALALLDRFRAKRAQLETFTRLLPASQDQNQAKARIWP